jgi:hypothetical protein
MVGICDRFEEQMDKRLKRFIYTTVLIKNIPFLNLRLHCKADRRDPQFMRLVIFRN